METYQVPPKNTWLVAFCLLLSLLLLPFVLGRILWDTSVFDNVLSHEIARFVSFFGFLLAQPLGWLNTIIGSKIISRRPKIGCRIIAIVGIVIGVLGILTGLIWSAIAVFGRV